MSFSNFYTISNPADLQAPPLVHEVQIAAGLYNDGILSVLDKELSNSALYGWRWLLGMDAIALVSTAIGDLFFWSEQHGAIYFLDVQQGRSTFIDRDVRYLFDTFLVKKEVRESVLNEQFLQLLARRLGPLAYGECYIAEPWKMLGGQRRCCHI